MAELKCKTKWSSHSKAETDEEFFSDYKPKVYFTCHKNDFDASFDKICDDIFRTHDCVVYYTENMDEPFDEEEKEVTLGRMNLFVIPVTFRLMNESNRAMACDFDYAKRHHIPVLPIMLEPGIDEIYSKPENFGERHYISPFSNDSTERNYEEKLKNYLDTVLINNEMAERIRAAFDAYVFLSYRKKDRRYANELMGLIHSRPEFYDIAIWYDEFLTPGESFNAAIEKNLRDSGIFALLVTPNLLEEPNYVMNREYPMARSEGKIILPAEMEETDKWELCKKFEGIPECICPMNDEESKERFLQSIMKIATSANDHDPEHNFLIGLAYLEGIDVEINRERGVALITKAAEAELPEAMEKLYEMYSKGESVQIDYREALMWVERIFDYDAKKYGEDHVNTLTALSNMSYVCSQLGYHKRAMELELKTYTSRCRVLGEEHSDTLVSLNNLASTYIDLGDYPKALELNNKAYSICCRIYGEEHPESLATLSNLACTYGKVGDHQKALELKEKAYLLCCSVYGDEHSYTLTILNNLASTYGSLGDYRKALQLNEKVYALKCKVLGNDHPDTVRSLNNLAYVYAKNGNPAKALKICEKAYTLYCRVLGDEHPDTLMLLNNMADAYGKMGNYQKSLTINEKVYNLRCKVLGDDHPDTISSLNNCACACGVIGNISKALVLAEKAYVLSCKVIGKKHENTMLMLENLAYLYTKTKDFPKALAAREKLHAHFLRKYGENHARTLENRRMIEILEQMI